MRIDVSVVFAGTIHGERIINIKCGEYWLPLAASTAAQLADAIKAALDGTATILDTNEDHEQI